MSQQPQSLHRFVRHEQAMDYVLLGWLPLPSLNGTHHGQWAVHLTWICGCSPVTPLNIT
jgi:hypothetical protein